ncbi:hypothetical protein, partial [Actinokineospora auranticolor]|uniref:hypothetical protein n=1 Tax=Actinokineospora auranticolor TaxID=155976 RepID=UPI000CEC59D7
REKLLLDPAKTVSFQRTQFYLVHCPETSKHLTTARQRVLAELRGEGWELELTSPGAPFQLEGRAPSGEEFYFRCRWSTCSLEFGDFDDPAWYGEYEIEDGGEYAASNIEPDEAVRVLRLLHERWLAESGR